ncbi:hypothetical protein CAPTEDRAFT_220452 [Capitella teleta]|uniref:Apple domain-containing protein n=1 Tax=Capitella teleta TaxID=283909 RepID=R7V4I7_CAPTE|nr:hypothetical protein CAPTEDRAFT_220452 [Capitella teleta]|eukprot:ELU13753.1 hypothetical protein CAPTEDRAFT_220452 [Capitella teleta]
MERIILLLLAVVPSIIAFKCNLSVQEWIPYSSNGYVEEQDIDSFANTDLDECKQKCIASEECNAIEYNSQDQKCRLSSVRASSDEVFIEIANWVTYNIKCTPPTTPAVPTTPANSPTTTISHVPTTPTTSPPISELCGNTAVSWFKLQGKKLILMGGQPLRKTVRSESLCRQRCLEESSFECRSFNYEENSKDCNIFSTPNPDDSDQIKIQDDADMALSILSCAREMDHCKSSETEAWRNIQNSAKEQNLESITVDGLSDLQQCQSFCSEWTFFPCSSVEFISSSKMCKLWKTSDAVVSTKAQSGTTFSQRICNPASAVTEQESTLNLAWKPEYIVLLGMGCVIFALLTIIVVVIATSPRKSAKSSEVEDSEGSFPY